MMKNEIELNLLFYTLLGQVTEETSQKRVVREREKVGGEGRELVHHFFGVFFFGRWRRFSILFLRQASCKSIYSRLFFSFLDETKKRTYRMVLFCFLTWVGSFKSVLTLFHQHFCTQNLLLFRVVVPRKVEILRFFLRDREKEKYHY